MNIIFPKTGNRVYLIEENLMGEVFTVDANTDTINVISDLGMHETSITNLQFQI